MKSKITITLLFLLVFTSVFARKKEIKSITEDELKAHLEFIASDFMQGRDFGTKIPGLEITAEYLKSQCLKMGLKQGGENFTQPFKMISIKSDSSKTFIKLENREGNKEFISNDIVAFPGSYTNDTINADIVFAGYGHHNKETGYNDFEGLEMKDKIVMIMTRNLEIASDTLKNDDNTDMEMAKLARIYMLGAKAIIFIADPLNHDKSWFGMVKDYAREGTYQLGQSDESEISANIILASNEIANTLLKETGKTLEEIQREINETEKPNSFELKNVSAQIQLAKKVESVAGENIIAVVEGSDPVLKNECIVLSAHYDHVGITGNGEVNNGADDNGSGTVSLLEIAEAFSKMKKKPRRSIVFAWVTAEEKGLVGSEYYTLNPFFPLEKTIANINLDMVGRSAEKELEKVDNPDRSLAGPNGIYIISGNQSSELTEISNKICVDLHLVPSNALTEEFMNGSDQYNFYKKGIPVLGLTTGLHEDYHYPTDDVDKIDFHKMKRIADFTFLVTNEIANNKKRIVVDNPVRQR